MADPNRIPLEAIRYFEASARHRSFTKAGRELNISQSAVSQKVIQLEDILKVKLFQRNPKQLELTDEGKALFQTAHDVINSLNATISTLGNKPLDGALTVLVSPAIGSKWLTPKLPAFFQQFPDIMVRIEVNTNLIDPNADFLKITHSDWDLVISPCRVDSIDHEQQHLFDDYYYPVASPDLIRTKKIKTPTDLKRCPILLDAEPKVAAGADWESWLEDIGLASMDLSKGHSFNQLDLMIKAAILGQGVAIARHSLVADDVSAGRLVKLFNQTPAGSTYLILQKMTTMPRHIKVFIDWIRAVAADTLPSQPVR